MKINWKHQEQEQWAVGEILPGETFLLLNKPYMKTSHKEDKSPHTHYAVRLDTGSLVPLEGNRQVTPQNFVCKEE